MWTFEITTGKMFAPDGSLAGTGYAGGNLGTIPQAINNPEYCNISCVGPLPEGFYTFGELQQHNPHLGQYVFPLIPDSDNKMFGRSGFYCHGGTSGGKQNASEGCIVIPYVTRQAMHNSPDQRLQVVGTII